MNMFKEITYALAEKVEEDFGFRHSKCFDMALQFYMTLPKDELSLDKIDDYYRDLKKKIISGEIIWIIEGQYLYYQKYE